MNSNDLGIDFQMPKNQSSQIKVMGIGGGGSNAVNYMFENGIIDPVKVTRCALKNAASVAGTLITTNHAIVEV